MGSTSIRVSDETHEKIERLKERGESFDQTLDRLAEEKLRERNSELARAYRENAELARQTEDEWKHASVEADRRLGDAEGVVTPGEGEEL
ncbi:antitoxin VapB family protein [Halomarina pelagica]|uniref:antitoxin VapB family protein n=1 Tax=Halomarina pelagica TaxID=2961599 RepID=UPI0020C2D2D5|nr:antitoxin VapB family protein [Halomarina sp. BND7]